MLTVSVLPLLVFPLTASTTVSTLWPYSDVFVAIPAPTDAPGNKGLAPGTSGPETSTPTMPAITANGTFYTDRTLGRSISRLRVM